MASALTIAETAAATGLSIDTLRFYEKDGLLLRPVPRSSAGHRRYEPQDLSWIEFLNKLRSTGLPLRDIARCAELVRAGSGNETERLELLRAHRQRVLEQLALTTEHLGAIDRKIGIYEAALDMERTPASEMAS
jgi:DNA-binding transcriptional MerR regulator